MPDFRLLSLWLSPSCTTCPVSVLSNVREKKEEKRMKPRITGSRVTKVRLPSKQAENKLERCENVEK